MSASKTYVVWKFHLGRADDLQQLYRVQMPWNADILSFKKQDGNLVLWAKVSGETLDGKFFPADPRERTFVLVGTGSPMADSAFHYNEYIGTEFFGKEYGGKSEGGLVFHLFEDKQKRGLIIHPCSTT